MDISSENVQAPVIQPINKSDKMFATVGKIVTLLIIVGILAFGAYYFGIRSAKPQQLLQIKPTATPTIFFPTSTIAAPTPTTTNTPVPSGKKVSAGIKNQFFSPFTITIPSGWIDTHTSNTASDTLTVTKGQYILTISQASGGAGACDFPGDTPEPMAQVLTSPVGITGTSSQFKRGIMDSTTFTVCEQRGSSFSFPTSFGYITYKTPSTPDQIILSEMDGMVASLTK